jgi:hypothetical protein
MQRYDPKSAPNSAAWLALDEGERMELVRRFHRKARVKVPSEQLHVATHVIVETQAAMGDATPVAKAIERLMHEGLDRHEAIHAVGSVLAEHLWDASRAESDQPPDLEAPYFQEVRELTAKRWTEKYS